ncbi:cupin domain-containing protein [Aestuariivirga sp.]|jgi:quercetin dioxygenase-like cupin family protein|uniref:cupin domain-containing protein n=1 Tax=Aestuariivirga sp. TaxID=2650926 RepID=UPI003784530B
MVAIYRAKLSPSDIRSIVLKSLPEQGCVEIQRDMPGKEHSWHQHATNETIVVLHGSLRFYWDEGAAECGPGDAISLPAGTRHGSVALDDGATYMIAFRDVGKELSLWFGQDPQGTR